MAAAAFPFEWTATIPFEQPRHAECVHQTLAVDPELRPAEVERELCVHGAVLTIHFRARSARMLRAAVGTFLDLVALAIHTLETFKTSLKD